MLSIGPIQSNPLKKRPSHLAVRRENCGVILGGSGPGTCPPTLHDGPPLRGRATYRQPALHMPRPTVSPGSPFHQHRDHHQAPIPLETTVHTRPAILQIPAIRGFPAIQRGHDNHTDAPSQHWVPGKANVSPASRPRQTGAREASIFLYDNG